MSHKRYCGSFLILPGIPHSGEGRILTAPHGAAQAKGPGHPANDQGAIRASGQQLCEGPSWNPAFQPRSNLGMTEALADGLPIASPGMQSQNPAPLSHLQILMLQCCEIGNACCFQRLRFGVFC